MEKKRIVLRIIAAIIAMTAIALCFASCSSGNAEESEPEVSYGEMPEYDVENIESYIKPFTYKGLVLYMTYGEKAQEKLWSEISESAEVIKYPEAQVEYYAEQERASYRYLAKRDGVDYDALLEGMGVTEESIYSKARGLVKDDLILAYIIKDAGLSLTEEEKLLYFDKYVEKYVTAYGYDKEYVKTNMADQIYDSMLYDKTMEYLLLNNIVNTTQSI